MGLFSLFRSNKNAASSSGNESKEALSESMKADFRSQLKRDASKEFDAEWVRTTNLERQIIDRFGFAGVKLVFESSNSENYFELGSFPDDCPWKNVSHLSSKAAIDFIFRPLAQELPQLIETMKERILHIYAERMDSGWRLHYLLRMKTDDRRNSFTVYSGSEPIKDETPNPCLANYRWMIPTDLLRLYGIHDGFGNLRGVKYILGSQGLAVQAELMDPICEEYSNWPEDYRFSDLLEFFPDGSGNAQCFHRAASKPNITVDWDHETWELSDEIGFFEFVDERLSEVDEE